jgi:hypothetical protein
MAFGSFSIRSLLSEHTATRRSFWPLLRIMDTNFVAMQRILISCDIISWHVRLRSSRIVSRTFAEFTVVVPVEDCPERLSLSTDISTFFKTLKPFSRFGLGLVTKCFFKHVVRFRCRLTEFETQFNANLLFLHINHFNKSLR